MTPAPRRQLDDVVSVDANGTLINIRARNRDCGRSRRTFHNVRMAPALMKQCQLEGCDYTFGVGLATQDLVLNNLELRLKFHELLELHLRFHELTTDQTESAVEMKKNETNCEGDELRRGSRPHPKNGSCPNDQKSPCRGDAGKNH